MHILSIFAGLTCIPLAGFFWREMIRHQGRVTSEEWRHVDQVLGPLLYAAILAFAGTQLLLYGFIGKYFTVILSSGT